MDGPGRRSFALSLNRSATRGGRLTTNILLSNNSPGEVQWKLSNPSEDDDPPFLPLLHGGRRTAFSQSQLHADLSKKKKLHANLYVSHVLQNSNYVYLTETIRKLIQLASAGGDK
jgi:hypothetical protein